MSTSASTLQQAVQDALAASSSSSSSSSAAAPGISLPIGTPIVVPDLSQASQPSALEMPSSAAVLASTLPAVTRPAVTLKRHATRSKGDVPVADPASKKLFLSEPVSSLIRTGFANGMLSESILGDLVSRHLSAPDPVVDLTDNIANAAASLSAAEYSALLTDFATDHASSQCAAQQFGAARDFFAKFKATTLPKALSLYTSSGSTRVLDIFGDEYDALPFFASNVRPSAHVLDVTHPVWTLTWPT
jgi:hypothetical protein